MTTRRITSVIEEVSLASWRNREHGTLDASFTDDERTDLLGRPVQSQAGIYAMKRALSTLCRSLYPDGVFDESSFSIVHNADGAPVIERFPEFSVDGRPFMGDRFLISLTHTRTTAYGLAVVEEPL